MRGAARRDGTRAVAGGLCRVVSEMCVFPGRGVWTFVACAPASARPCLRCVCVAPCSVGGGRKKGTGHGRHKHRRRHTRAHGRTEAQAHGHTTERDSATAPRPTWSRTRQRRTLTPIHVQVHHIPHHARLRHNSGEDNTLRRTRDPTSSSRRPLYTPRITLPITRDHANQPLHVITACTKTLHDPGPKLRPNLIAQTVVLTMLTTLLTSCCHPPPHIRPSRQRHTTTRITDRHIDNHMRPSGPVMRQDEIAAPIRARPRTAGHKTCRPKPVLPTNGQNGRLTELQGHLHTALEPIMPHAPHAPPVTTPAAARMGA